MSQEAVLIFGAGGHGKVVLDILRSAAVEVVGFLDEDARKEGATIGGLRILGGWDYLERHPGSAVALGVGNNRIRARLYAELTEAGHGAVTAIHARATIGGQVQVGPGVVVMPGAVVNAGSILEAGCVVNTGATVDHDCRLAEFSQVWPGAHLAGAVTVGAGSYVGTGAAVIPNVTIGCNVMIGAGAAVVNDLPDDAVAVGVPARIIRMQTWHDRET